MAAEAKKEGVLSRVIDAVSGIFLPLVNLLSAAGIMKGVLVILTTTGVIDSASQTYIVLDAMASSLFNFLPILLCATTAKKFGANPFTAAVIGGVLLYPSLVAIQADGGTVSFFGIPLLGVKYASSVFPAILAGLLLVVVERFLNRALPEVIRGFLTPLLSIILVSFVTLFAFGPFGKVVGDGLAAGYEWVYALSPVVAGALLGAVVQPMVIFGFHWSLIIIGMNNIAVSGQDTVLALMGPAVFAQMGAALAVMIKSHDAAFKSTCASAAVSALFGITEPAMFGVNLPRKKPLVAVCVGGGVGGAIAGLSGATAKAFAFPSVAALPIFFGDGFGLYLVSCAVGAVVAFVCTMVFKFDVDIKSEEAATEGAEPVAA